MKDQFVAEEVWWVAELVCMLCGRDQGTLRMERRDQPIFAPRCEHCGGMPVAREVIERRKFIYAEEMLIG